MVPTSGIEPLTSPYHGLVIPFNYAGRWCTSLDSNQGLVAYEAVTLPLSYTYMVPTLVVETRSDAYKATVIAVILSGHMATLTQ